MPTYADWMKAKDRPDEVEATIREILEGNEFLVKGHPGLALLRAALNEHLEKLRGLDRAVSKAHAKHETGNLGAEEVSEKVAEYLSTLLALLDIEVTFLAAANHLLRERIRDRDEAEKRAKAAREELKRQAEERLRGDFEEWLKTTLTGTAFEPPKAG